MNDWKFAITLTICCGIYLTVASAASADFVGVTTVNKDDPETDFQCTQGNGAFVPGPLTVCNVFAVFDDPTDRLLSVGNADLQVYNGANPDVFFQHPLIPSAYPPSCLDILEFPDLICDSFVAFGPKCYYVSWWFSTDGDFDHGKFAFNGHIVGGWHSSVPDNGQGDAGTWPDLQVLFLQSSVAQGLSLSGDIDVFWQDDATGDIFAEQDLPIECVAVGGCQDPEDCDDGNACTDDICADGGCSNPTIGCSDGNPCTDDLCDPDMGCTHEAIECSKGQVCDPASGKCVEDQDPCECVNGRVTLCHIPPGNPENARTITVGCAARDRHLAHGDSCGPCE